MGFEMALSLLGGLALFLYGMQMMSANLETVAGGRMKEILEKLGAKVVYPEQDMAIRLAHRLEASRTLDYIQLSEKLNISKLMIPEKMAGKTVLEVNLRKNFGVNIIAVENERSLIEVVKPEDIFRRGDILYVSGSKEGLNRLSQWAE